MGVGTGVWVWEPLCALVRPLGKLVGGIQEDSGVLFTEEGRGVAEEEGKGEEEEEAAREEVENDGGGGLPVDAKSSCAPPSPSPSGMTLEGLPAHVLVEHVLPRLALAGVCSVGACSRQLREAAGSDAFWRAEAARQGNVGAGGGSPARGGRVPVRWARRVGALVDFLVGAGALSEKHRFACRRAAHVRAFRYGGGGLHGAVAAGDVVGVVGQVVARCAGGEGAAPGGEEVQAGMERSRWRRYRLRLVPPPKAEEAGSAGGDGGGGGKEGVHKESEFTAEAATAPGQAEHAVLAGVLARAECLVNERGEESGEMPLRTAVRNGDGAMVRLLLALGALPNVGPGARSTLVVPPAC